MTTERKAAVSSAADVFGQVCQVSGQLDTLRGSSSAHFDLTASTVHTALDHDPLL